MSYYNPSYYNTNNYPYGMQYSFPIQQQQQMNMMPQNQPQPQSAMLNTMQNQNLNSGLNGKIVDSEDVVKATEVPIGGYGIFPKADLSEIYIKSWNNNGTTSVITFHPIAPEEKQAQEIQNADSEFSKIILQKIELLENKIDTILNKPITTVAIEQPAIQQKQINSTKKVEVPKNGF